MFREMRRKDKKMALEEALELLKNGEYGFLSTVGEDGYAYGVPLNYAYVDNKIYFHCARTGLKLDNLKFNNKVSFCVVGKTEVVASEFSEKYESVMAFGKAYETEGEEKEAGLFELVKKYSSNFIPEGKDYINRDGNKTCVIRIDVEHITGKAGR